MATEQLLSISAAADYLGISRQTFHRRLNDGSIPSVKLGPRRYIARATLESIIVPGSANVKAAS